MEENYEALIDRISGLEKAVENGITISTPVVQNAKEEEKPKKEPLQVAIPDDIKEIVDNWTHIYPKLSGYMKSMIGNARMATDGSNVLSVVFSDATVFGSARLHEAELSQDISSIVGKQTKVKMTLLEEGESFTDHYMEAISKINFNITEE